MIVCLSYLNQPDNYDIINQRKLLLLWRFIMNNNCVILIPALDPPEIFLSYIDELIQVGFKDILVVDDGSHQKKIFEKIGSLPQVTVLTHPENYGKGRALRTGLAYYKDHYSYDEYCGVITADSDGQHLVDDVLKISKSLAKREDKMILGVRDFNQSNVPSKSRIGNKLTSLGFRVLIGLSVSDTQTGLREIPNPLIDLSLSIPGDRFQYETAVLIETGKVSGFEEIKIQTVYYDENKGTHFNPVKDSIQIFNLLLGTFFRYIFVSLSSFVVDILLFALGTKLLFPALSVRIPLSTAFARIISGAYNYAMNRKIVFKSDRSVVSSGFSYLMLCIIQCAVSAGLVTAICYLLPLDEVPVKAVVDTCLFFVNYKIQKNYIFKNKETL